VREDATACFVAWAATWPCQIGSGFLGHSSRLQWAATRKATVAKKPERQSALARAKIGVRRMRFGRAGGLGKS
jgi:hypothetical protein